MSIDEFKQFVFFIINKSQSGHSLTPDRFNILLPQANFEYIHKQLGLEGDYQPGRALPRIAKNITSRVTDNIRVLKETAIIPIVSGMATIPADYVDWDGIRATYTYKDECDGKKKDQEVAIEILDENEWGTRLNAAILKNEPDFPVLKFNNTYFDVEPKTMKSIVLVYFRNPGGKDSNGNFTANPPKWAYTVANDEELYDAANSVQLELPAITHYEIARILLSYVGIHLSNDRLIAYAEQKKREGI